MNTLIAGFVGPQEIILILLFVFSIFVLVFVFIVIRAIKTSRRNRTNESWSVKEEEHSMKESENKMDVQKNARENFPVKEGSKVTLIPFIDIVDFSAANSHVFLTDILGKDYVVETNLNDLMSKLPSVFIRVHKSTILNSNLIRKVKKLANGRYDLVMKCEKERIISCSKSYNEKIKSIIDF